MTKIMFTVGVFGFACRKNEDGDICLKLNVRTDQVRQLQLAGLPADSTVKIIDAPGGGVELEDFPDMKEADLMNILRREVSEETGGCTIESLGELSAPFLLVTNNQDGSKAAGDMALWMPIILNGEPQVSDEAIEHPWITWEEFESEANYRCVGKLGKNGRMGRMIRAAFEFFAAHDTDEFLSSCAKSCPILDLLGEC